MTSLANTGNAVDATPARTDTTALLAGQVSLERDGDDLVVHFDAGRQMQRVAGYFSVVTHPQAQPDTLRIQVRQPGAAGIAGSAAPDLLVASTEDSVIKGHKATDILIGRDGDDWLDGQAGNDYLYGGQGDDVLKGRRGHDQLFGEDGDDSLVGNDGDDHLEGGTGNDDLFGNNGNDSLHGGHGEDALRGGAGNDVLHGGPGNDLLKGGAGSDWYLFDRGGGHDIIDGSGARRGDSDSVHLGPGIAAAEVRWQRVGMDMRMTLSHAQGEDILCVRDWYAENSNRVGQFVFADNSVLSANQVEQLVSSMSSFDVPGGSTFVAQQPIAPGAPTQPSLVAPGG